MIDRSPAFSHRLEVRFRDCDAMGHVNNAVYLTYLEQARFAHWQALGGFVPEGSAEPGVILARAEIDFRLPVRYGAKLDVRLTVAGVGRTSFTYEYAIVDEQGRTVATARSVQVMYDYASGRPMPVPDLLRARLQPPPPA